MGIRGLPRRLWSEFRSATEQNQTYNNSLFFIVVLLQFSIKFCFSGCLVLITNSKLVISVGKRRGFSRRLWFLIKELFHHKKIFLVWSLYLDENHSLLDNHLIPIQDLNTNFLLEPKNGKPEIWYKRKCDVGASKNAGQAFSTPRLSSHFLLYQIFGFRFFSPSN